MARKDGTLGKAKARRYDLPFQQNVGTRAMTMVIALMVFLGFLCAALSLTLHALGTRWTTGLEGKMTVEIPAQGLDQSIRDRDELGAIADEMVAFLKQQPAVTAADVVSEEDIAAMIAPWLGDFNSTAGLPLPVLISVEAAEMDEAATLKIQNGIISIDPGSRLDTHEDWLGELLRFTGAMNLAAAVMALVITLTTLLVTAGVVRARLAAHVADVELLHLMGATNSYIARQFQGHILTLSVIGGALGCGLGIAMIKSIGWIAGRLGLMVMPDFAFAGTDWVMLCLVPVVIICLCFVTARATILGALKLMP